MQLGAIVFIIPWKALYVFRVLFTPIFRSVLKPYMQLLLQLCIGMASYPICYNRPDLTPYRYTIVTKTACTVLI
jgi:hypothetical protein